MIVSMTARYSALTYESAVAQGTQIWRNFIDDPDAELPWDASLRVDLGEDRIDSAAGEHIDSAPFGEAVLTVKVTKESNES